MNETTFVFEGELETNVKEFQLMVGSQDVGLYLCDWHGKRCRITIELLPEVAA